jgi:flagellar hook-associated protein 2
VTASIVESAHGQFRLVLTSTNSGLANAFAVTTVPTGGSGVAFADPNAQEADDASLSINGLAVTSSSNTLTSAIPGTTLSLLHGDGSTTTVAVAADDTALTTKVKTLLSAYNDLVKFMADQRTAAGNGTTGTLAHEAILQQARTALRGALTGSYGSGTFTNLAEVASDSIRPASSSWIRRPSHRP